MKTLIAWLEEHKYWTFEFLRMYLGLVLILKGIYFIRDMDQLLALIGLSASIWAGGLFAHYIVLAWVTTLEVLPSGNIVLGNCHAGPGQPLLVEIEPKTKRVVAQFDGFAAFGNNVSNSQLLDVKTLR